MNRYATHTATTLFLLLAGSAQAVELIVNGGFEAAPPAPGGTINYAGPSGPPGWTHVGGTVSTLDTGYAEGPTVFQAHGGMVSMDLTGPGNTGPTSGLTQAVSTLAGQLYSLSFWLGNAQSSATESYNLPSALALQIDGDAPIQFTNSSIVMDRNHWQQFVHSFVAAGTTTTLTFRNATASADNQTGLDDISLLAAVPEPGTWALMLAGIGTLLLRRGGSATARQRAA
jgi:hypothetical protein